MRDSVAVPLFLLSDYTVPSNHDDMEPPESVLEILPLVCMLGCGPFDFFLRC